MAIDKVREYLKQWSADGRIREFQVSSATVELAAQALNCEGSRIAKTLSFETADGCILVVAAGDAKIDNAKYKARFGTKAKMIPAAEVEEKIGHAVGGRLSFCGKRRREDLSGRIPETVSYRVSCLRQQQQRY